MTCSAPRSLRIVFFGTAEFAVPCLDALVDAGHQVLAVVTQPDRQSGRGRHLVLTPVKLAALRHGLPITQPRRVRAAAFLATMRELAPDVLALAAYGQIVPQELLELPPLGPINVHGSLLPKYRGAAPVQRAIMAGEQETGVTTMWMDATLDTGDVLLTDTMRIDPEDDAGTLLPKLADLGAALLVKTLNGLVARTIARRRQDDSQASFAPAIQPEEAIIRWGETSSQIVNRIRGLTPRPGAYAEAGTKRVKVWSAAAAIRSGQSEPPGTILGFSKSPPGVLVAAGEGTTALLREAQPENGKRMAADAWARGVRIKAGDRLTLAYPAPSVSSANSSASTI